MRIIKVSATESTNTLAREWYHTNKNKESFCVAAKEQTLGRGQRGSGWVSNAGENLTMSMVYLNPAVNIQDQFVLSASVGMAILNALEDFNLKKLKLKWPNDIMAANFKIGGILIENILNNGRIIASIIGVGLNVNQVSFPMLPKAASIKSLTEDDIEIDHIMKKIIFHLQKSLDLLKVTSAEVIIENYEEVLFRKGIVSTFELINGEFLTGIISGITSTGLLKVQVEDEKMKLYDLKELKLLF
jgi:BirA family biotin operon repressor/biotin-[acetyl-CoA-carboxylase] ligase